MGFFCDKSREKIIFTTLFIVALLGIAFFGLYFWGYGGIEKKYYEDLGVSAGTVRAVFGLPGARVVYIPAGSFLMGSPESEAGRNEDEKQHKVKLSRGFWMWQTEVTQGQFKAVMGYNPSYFSKCGDNCPVEFVSWNEAAAFANRLSEKEGFERCFECKGEGRKVSCKVRDKFRSKDYYSCKGWRLPTEAEWEYAYRAGSGRARYGKLDNIGWFIRNSGGRTHPVKQKKPNSWGLYDMGGNVGEWVVDWYGPYNGEVSIDPVNFTNSDSGRVRRGGSWGDYGQFIRAGYRYWLLPTVLSHSLGFRLVKSGGISNSKKEHVKAENSKVKKAESGEKKRKNTVLKGGLENKGGSLKVGSVRSVFSLPGARAVYIPAGSFLMGSPLDEPGRDDDERQYKVRLTRGFWMWQTEVTQGQFKALMGYNPSYFLKCGDNCPVERVSWDDAAVFANELSDKEGLETCFECKGAGRTVSCKVREKFRSKKYYSCKGWRLPTEAEWEYVYRAGTKSPYYTGRCITIEQANWDGRYPIKGCPKGKSLEKTLAVKSFKPNGWGLYDMAGNVGEWVADRYGSYPRGLSVDPVNFSVDSEGIWRGGSWASSGNELRAAYRRRFNLLRPNVGFRLVKTKIKK